MKTVGTMLFPVVNADIKADEAAEAIEKFLKKRPDGRWVLLGNHAVQSTEQLWAAWTKAARNELRGTMVARSIDAEFIRYLAGTHHISEAFARAGLQNGQTSAWIVCLPEAGEIQAESGHAQPQPVFLANFENRAEALLSSLGWGLSESAMRYSIEGAKQLGIDVESWVTDRRFESLVAHVLMADDQSSSHR